MRWMLVCTGLLLAVPVLHAQFPFTRSLEIRSGQQRPSIQCLAQDGHGLLWLGTDRGLLRTDGERVDVILRVENGSVTAVHALNDTVWAATSTGMIVRCHASACDTLFTDERLASAQVGSMLVDRTGTVWIGTPDTGIWTLNAGVIAVIGQEQGLRDEHINDMALLADGRVVVATDQGLAVCNNGRVTWSLGEAEGAPDNLIFSVAVAPNGSIHAGTDRNGAFRWNIDGDGGVIAMDKDWDHGEVNAIAVQDGFIWMAARGSGVFAQDALSGGSYHRPAEGRRDALDLMVDRNGAVWWCDGTEFLHRADAAILIVPSHEGLDLRNSTAICSDPAGRVWFATQQGLFNHATAFSEEHTIAQVPVSIDPRTPIVSLTSTSDGTIWAGTFGGGAIAIFPDGAIRYFTSRDNAVNDNVLSVRAHGRDVWLATFEGLVHVTPELQLNLHPLPFPGFVFDVLPMADGSVLAATDGNGVLRLLPDRSDWELLNGGDGTWYSLALDADGNAWAAGPGTGICRVGRNDNGCHGAALPPFDGDLFGLQHHEGRLLAFGSTGTLLFDRRSGTTTNVAARSGTVGVRSELNAVTVDNDGSIWLAGDEGLIRMRPTAWHFGDSLETVITAIISGGTVLPAGQVIDLPHDHERLLIQFTAINYVDPGAVRFEYRIVGADERSRITRDREISLASLAPGRYTVQIRAFAGVEPAGDEWTAVDIHVRQPLWMRPWSIILLTLLVAGVIAGILKMRERRIRERERLEQEKVRFQLEALRSQVDPHFLFNSFNTLVELIESDTSRAVDHVEHLSMFFRNILLVRDKELIKVEEELRLLENYFQLEQIRFGDAISLQVDVSQGDRRMCIVPLTLQLLVENSLKHNVATRDQPVVIDVRSHEGELIVSNPVRPKIASPRSTGFGLDSIQKRYAALSRRKIRVERAADSFTVGIPLIQPRDEGSAHRG